MTQNTAVLQLYYAVRGYRHCLNFRKLFSMAAIVLAILATGLAVLHPAANAFALMTLGLPAFFLLIHELKR